MKVLIVSEGNAIYCINLTKNKFWQGSSFDNLKKNVKEKGSYPLTNLFNWHPPKNFTICKGPFRFQNLEKHFQLYYPEWLI